MRILQIVHNFPPFNFGGTEVYTYYICKELKKTHQVFILHRINDLKLKEYSIFNYNLDSLEVYAINNTFREYYSFESTYKNGNITKKFSEVLTEIKPDIVHIQHLLYLSFSIIEEIKKRNIPIIFTLHDYWPICPQGQLLKSNYKICDEQYTYQDCIECIPHYLCITRDIFNFYYLLKKVLPNNLLIAIMKGYFNLMRKFLFLNDKKILDKMKDRRDYIKRVLSFIDIFIAPSNFIKNKFINLGIKSDKIILNRFGINLDIFKDFSRIPSNKLRFGFIGGILPAKGIHILIEAFNRIKNKNIELKIYGKFSSYKGILCDYFNYIKKNIKNNNIKFMGDFNNYYVADVLKEIDVLIVPSIWPENFPLVIQEAFATVTPVIASDIGGIPEVIKDNLNGILFRAGDSDDLYKKIELIINNPKILEDLKKNIRPPKDIKTDVLELELIYNQLL